MASGGEGDSKNNQLKPSSSITRFENFKLYNMYFFQTIMTRNRLTIVFINL